MTRGILIAGNESTLSQTIAAEAAKRVEHYAAAIIPGRLSESIRITTPEKPAVTSKQAVQKNSVVSEQTAAHNEGSFQTSGAFPLQWNPGSPISARTLILAAENRLGHINEALLICTPPSTRRSAAELSMADIEITVNDHIKSWFYIVRELASVFRSRQAGTLALVFSEIGTGGKDDSADLLGPAALASFQAFTRSLLAIAHNEPYLTLGFSCSEAGAEAGFSSYIFKILDGENKRNSGKLFKYGKLGFLK